MNSARPRATGSPRRAARRLLPAASLLAALLLPLVLATTCGGCADGKEEHLVNAAPEPTRLTVAGKSVTVELALTDEQRGRGLMGRTHLDAEAGMLFIFPTDAPQTFWMKNTLIPLDIVFLAKDGTVKNIADALPGVEKPGYNSLGLARMVLELNEGWCARNGLKPGDRVIVPEGLLEKAKD